MHSSIGRVFAGGMALWLACAAPTQASEPQARRNWFDDPFFQVSSGLPHCPVPLGPLLTVQEQRAEAHGRIERGTSCWLIGLLEQAARQVPEVEGVVPMLTVGSEAPRYRLRD